MAGKRSKTRRRGPMVGVGDDVHGKASGKGRGPSGAEIARKMIADAKNKRKR